MDHKEILILPVVGILIMVNIWILPLIPSFSFVSAYILVQNYGYESNKRLASRVALIFFLLVFLLLIFAFSLPLGGGLLIGFPLFILNVSAIFLCLLIIIDFIIPLKRRKSTVLFGVLFYLSLSIIIFISFLISLGGFDTIGTIVSLYTGYIILLAILLSLALICLLKLRKDYKREEILFEGFDSSFVKKEIIFKMDKENFGSFMLYFIGGLFLSTCIYFLFVEKDMRYTRALFNDLFPLIPILTWCATFLGLSSKHKISDLGFIIFGAIFLPFFFSPSFYDLHLFTTETMLGIIRVLLGISFTLILLGYDIRRIPRKGLIEYSIYGLSFIPLVSSLIFVTPHITHPHLALIFALLILFKTIVTTGYVYKRIGIE